MVHPKQIFGPSYFVICKYYRVFPADIAKKTRRVPVNPCKHLQCMYSKALQAIKGTVMKKKEYLDCKPIPVMKTGFSLCCISHREYPVLAQYWPCTGLQCFHTIHEISN